MTKKELSDNGKFEVYHGSKDTPLGLYNDFNAPKNTVIIVNTGGIGGVKFIDKDFWCSDGTFWLGHHKKINSKFLYYYLYGYEDYFYSKKRVGGVPTIDRSIIEDLPIPIPPIEVQNKIVGILDRFDALCNDLCIGLPAEINARQKQYEYYRDQLLSFKEYQSSII
ncbi:hypothetical protein BKH41_05025 [Helicobacter sp. 12S02232-10]|nr:hypothetical protein BKH41_05025 [Helicobacter sp. 12S02232-10]